MLLPKFEVHDSKKLEFIKEQASGLLSSLGIKTFSNNSFIRSSFVLRALTI